MISLNFKGYTKAVLRTLRQNCNNVTDLSCLCLDSANVSVSYSIVAPVLRVHPYSLKKKTETAKILNCFGIYYVYFCLSLNKQSTGQVLTLNVVDSQLKNTLPYIFNIE